MTERDVVVRHPGGLHARPVALLVATAGRFDARVEVEHGGRRADARSLLGLLALGIGAGATVTLRAEGGQEKEAVDALARVLEEVSPP